MTNSKNILNQIFTLIALFILTTLSISPISAHTLDVEMTQTQISNQIAVENDFTNTISPFTPMNPSFYSPAAMGIKIKIKIIIIIKKKKKKGVVEAMGIRVLAGDKNTELKENEILMEMSREGNNILMQPIRGTHSNSILIIPQGFKVSKEVSLKLGSKRPLTLKAAQKGIRVNTLGNFEIQR
ncbi:MAG: hypothetical protein AB8B69_16990 [Chitinophagales bacterium]